MEQTSIIPFSLNRKFRKAILGRSWKPVLQFYLRKTRDYHYEGIIITVQPGIFHPGFFYSTRFLLQYLKGQDLYGKNVLELGCGSGLISVFAATKGANVIASDINEYAIENTLGNARKNKVIIETIHSDLFENIPLQKFDYIIINPPYYPGDPKNEEEYAWYCGSGFEYFQKLFKELPAYISNKSMVVMVLSEDCKIGTINQIAKASGFELNEIDRKKIVFEWNFLFQVTPVSK